MTESYRTARKALKFPYDIRKRCFSFLEGNTFSKLYHFNTVIFGVLTTPLRLVADFLIARQYPVHGYCALD